MIDLSEKDFILLKDIFAEYLPEAEVRVYGSRYNGNAKSYSDLDLAIVENKKISSKRLSDLIDALQESNLSIRVDVVDWNVISEEMKAVILRGYEVVWNRGEVESK